MSETDVEKVRHVLWMYGDHRLGLQPGKFHQSLIWTIQRADRENLARLRTGFPEYVGLVESMAEYGGLEEAIALVKQAVHA